MRAPLAKKPRLLMVCHRPPPLHGAAVMSEAAATSRVLHALFDITVIPIRANAGLGSLQRFGFGKLWSTVKLWSGVARALSTRPDALYLTANISGFAFWRDLVIALMAQAWGVKRVFHFHMKGARGHYERSRLMRAAYRRMFDGAEVIHLSERLYDDLAPVLPRERFHVVANGIDIGAVPQAERSARVPTVLFLSNLYESKGPLDLLDASRHVLERGIAHNLVFAGAAPEDAVIDRIRSAGPPVSWVGPVDASRKAALLAEADVFVFPSWYHFECQPLAVIEAMAAGKAIIASDQAAIPDLISDGETGLLVRGKAVDEISEALVLLLQQPNLRASLGAAAAARYRQTYTSAEFEQRLAHTLWRLCLPAATSAQKQAA